MKTFKEIINVSIFVPDKTNLHTGFRTNHSTDSWLAIDPYRRGFNRSSEDF